MRVRVRMYIYVYIKMPQREAGVFSGWEWESEGGLALWSMAASLIMIWPSPTILWRSIPHDSFLAVLVLLVELWRALGCPWNSCVSTSFVCGRQWVAVLPQCCGYRPLSAWFIRQGPMSFEQAWVLWMLFRYFGLLALFSLFFFYSLSLFFFLFFSDLWLFNAWVP